MSAIASRADAPDRNSWHAVPCSYKSDRKIPQTGAETSVAGLAIGGLELVQLRFALAGQFALGSLAIQIGSRAVVKSGLQIDPDLNIGIAFVFRRLVGGVGQAETDQQ